MTTKLVISKDRIISTKDENKEKDVAVYMGPGMWFMLHLMASEIESEADEDNFIRTLRMTCRRHACGNCQGHCKAYIEKVVPEKYKGILDDKGNRIGMSKYIHEFHNAVNQRLGKPEMKWETYFSIYYLNKESACTKDCGQEKVISSLKKLAESNPFVTYEK